MKPIPHEPTVNIKAGLWHLKCESKTLRLVIRHKKNHIFTTALPLSMPFLSLLPWISSDCFLFCFVFPCPCWTDCVVYQQRGLGGSGYMPVITLACIITFNMVCRYQSHAHRADCCYGAHRLPFVSFLLSLSHQDKNVTGYSPHWSCLLLTNQWLG